MVTPYCHYDQKAPEPPMKTITARIDDDMHELMEELKKIERGVTASDLVRMGLREVMETKAREKPELVEKRTRILLRRAEAQTAELVAQFGEDAVGDLRREPSD